MIHVAALAFIAQSTHVIIRSGTNYRAATNDDATRVRNHIHKLNLSSMPTASILRIC